MYSFSQSQSANFISNDRKQFNDLTILYKNNEDKCISSTYKEDSTMMSDLWPLTLV